jgi:hypothetical protein
MAKATEEMKNLECSLEGFPGVREMECREGCRRNSRDLIGSRATSRVIADIRQLPKFGEMSGEKSEGLIVPMTVETTQLIPGKEPHLNHAGAWR